MAKRCNPGGHDIELEQLEAALGYEFDDLDLLWRAVTHRSYANEYKAIDADNQRLEFLGDAVLGIVIADALFKANENAPEGSLSSQLSELVCEMSLVERAQDLDVGRFLLLGRGEELTGGREKRGVLADAYEAILGAVYLDGGYQAVQSMIATHFEQPLAAVVDAGPRPAHEAPGDYKSFLQREVQRRRPVRPEYRIIDTSGPPHDRRFVAQVVVGGREVGRGTGRSKKEAEQSAAAKAVADLEADEGLWKGIFDDITPPIDGERAE